MIGESKEAVISTYDWAQIENVCLRSINSMTTSQGNLITAVGVMSYLFITAIVIFKMLSSMTKGSRNKKLTWIHRLDEILDLLTSYGCIVGLGVLVFVVMLLTVQFWAFFRFRRLQCDMLEAAGSDCVDQEWSFGQIVAIAVFVPVLAESLFVWRKAMLYSGGNE